MIARAIIGDILILLTAAFTVCLSAVMIRRIRSIVLKSGYIKVFRYELAACACLILFALDVRFGFFTKFGPAVLKTAGWILRIIVALGSAVLLFFMGKIAAGGFIRTDMSARNVVVLGLALENGKPTHDLLSRLNTAEQYAKANPDTVLILTGGNPDGSGRTEAAVMRDLLAERGIPEDRMVLEDRAESTKDNFRNTALLVSPEEPMVLITSNYHMDRAVRTAKNAGFTRVCRLPAPSSPLLYGTNVMWETVLELNELTLKK